MRPIDPDGPLGWLRCLLACSSAFASLPGLFVRPVSAIGNRRRPERFIFIAGGIAIDATMAWLRSVRGSSGPVPSMKMIRRLSFRRSRTCRCWSPSSYPSCSCGSATAVSRRSRPMAAALPSAPFRSSRNFAQQNISRWRLKPWQGLCRGTRVVPREWARSDLGPPPCFHRLCLGLGTVPPALCNPGYFDMPE